MKGRSYIYTMWLIDFSFKASTQWIIPENQFYEANQCIHELLITVNFNP